MATRVREKGQRRSGSRMYLNACPRCTGDMMVEEWLGDADLVCPQCGYRRPISLQ